MSMKSVLIVFFILLLLVLIFIFPFKIRLMSHLNMFEMKGFYTFKIMRFQLLCGKVYVQNGEIVSNNSVNFFSKNYNKQFMKELSKQLVSRIDVKAMLCGSVSSLVETTYSILSQKYDNVKLFEDINPTYNDNNLEVTFDIVVSVSIYEIVKSIIIAQFKKSKLKEVENER